jgi:hypothetical protein
VSNSAHPYGGETVGRGARLKSKLGRAIALGRLEQLLTTHPQKEVKTMKNLSGYISGSYSATSLDDEKVAAFEAAAQKLNEAGAELGLTTTVSLTVTES